MPLTHPGGHPISIRWGYLFSGVWPSSATASSAFSSALKSSNAKSHPSVAAPEDGRTPLNRYRWGEGGVRGTSENLRDIFTKLNGVESNLTFQRGRIELY